MENNKRSSFVFGIWLSALALTLIINVVWPPQHGPAISAEKGKCVASPQPDMPPPGSKIISLADFLKDGPEPSPATRIYNYNPKTGKLEKIAKSDVKIAKSDGKDWICYVN